MRKLNQVLAIESSVKKRAEKQGTEAYQAIQKPATADFFRSLTSLWLSLESDSD